MLQGSSRSLLGPLNAGSLGVKSTRLAPLLASRCQGWQRWYSIHADHAVQRGLEIEPGKLSITKTTTPKDLVPNKELIFGHSFTGNNLPLTFFKPYS
jgi:hypothetical protein